MSKYDRQQYRSQMFLLALKNLLISQKLHKLTPVNYFKCVLFHKRDKVLKILR
jgi:hypothetical protein